MTNLLQLCKLWNFCSCIGILLLFGILDVAADCTCYPMHPQRHFCESDFVIKAMLNSSGIALPGGQNVEDNHLMTLPPEVINSANRVLKMRVMHVFKGKSFLFPHVTIEVNTPLFDGRCGVNYLQPHKPYIIMGKLEGEGMLTFNSCNWHRKWMDITARQKKGFRHTYKTNCDCHVHTCGIGSKCGDREKNFPKVCDWDPFKGACYNKHAACVKTDKKRCEWSYPTEHTDCEFPSR